MRKYSKKIVSGSLVATALVVAPIYASANDYEIWVKAFIPNDVENAIAVPQQSGKMVSADVFSRTVIGCFRTDDRGYSNDPSVKARVTTHITTDGSKDPPKHNAYCHFTEQLNCSSGDLMVKKRCQPGSPAKFQRSETNSGWAYNFTIKSPNPVIPSPDIDATIRVEEVWRNNRVEFRASGKIDSFPAFEAYVRYKGQTQKLFQSYPEAGKSPWNLFGPAVKEVSGSVVFNQ